MEKESGTAILKDGSTYTFTSDLLKTKNILMGTNVFISVSAMLDFHSKVHQYNVAGLTLDNYDEQDSSHSLYGIVDIKFPYLTSLTLRRNQINSFEGLSRISLPNLQNISLDQKGLRFRVLRKCWWENISELLLSFEYASSMESLSEIYTPKGLKHVYLTFQATIRAQNAFSLFKIQSKSLENTFNPNGSDWAREAFVWEKMAQRFASR